MKGPPLAQERLQLPGSEQEPSGGSEPSGDSQVGAAGVPAQRGAPVTPSTPTACNVENGPLISKPEPAAGRAWQADYIQQACKRRAGLQRQHSLRGALLWPAPRAPIKPLPPATAPKLSSRLPVPFHPDSQLAGIHRSAGACSGCRGACTAAAAAGAATSAARCCTTASNCCSCELQATHVLNCLPGCRGRAARGAVTNTLAPCCLRLERLADTV